jgi:hypothetical protein
MNQKDLRPRIEEPPALYARHDHTRLNGLSVELTIGAFDSRGRRGQAAKLDAANNAAEIGETTIEPERR